MASLLDTDLYKLTMQVGYSHAVDWHCESSLIFEQNAVRTLYPEAQAAYRFTNRTPSMKFSKAAYDYIKQSIKALDSLHLSVEERLWLRRTCPYFPEEYLEWLSRFRLNSDKEVKVAFKQEEGSEYGELDIASRSSLRARYSLTYMLRATAITCNLFS